MARCAPRRSPDEPVGLNDSTSPGRRTHVISSGKVPVVVVGQTPPPFGGQAVMIDAFVRGEYERLELVHIRLAFSKDVGDIGRLRAGKVVHLVATVVRIVAARYRSGARTLVYPPAGPDRVPMYRDLVILVLVRPFFSRVILHFHASGVSELYPSLAAPVRALFRAAYYRPDAGIRTSALNPDDPASLLARRSCVVPCGIEDLPSPPNVRRNEAETAALLYVGVLSEAKGVLLLVEACGLLKRRGVRFRLDLVGGMSSAAFSDHLRARIAEEGVVDDVRVRGVLTGQSKLDAYAGADVFCYPTFFEAESFGIVLLEAMRQAVPVVATRWRGIPSVVDDGVGGYLVEPRDAPALAERIGRLVADPDLAREMGQRGRERFLETFTVAEYRRRMEDVIAATAAGGAPEPLGYSPAVGPERGT